MTVCCDCDCVLYLCAVSVLRALVRACAVSVLCHCVLDADRCLRSDVITNSLPQARAGGPTERDAGTVGWHGWVVRVGGTDGWNGMGGCTLKKKKSLFKNLFF